MTHFFRTIATLFNKRSIKTGKLNLRFNKSLLLLGLALASTPLVGNAQANNLPARFCHI
jgi:hypothetical protein